MNLANILSVCHATLIALDFFVAAKRDEVALNTYIPLCLGN